jgi:hypothetical protein
VVQDSQWLFGLMLRERICNEDRKKVIAQEERFVG